MARPVDDPAQMLFAYTQFKAGVHTGAALWRKLVEQFGDNAKTERQARRWIENFRNLEKTSVRLDDPFEWHRLDEYGLPWEASYDLLRVWAFYQRIRAYVPEFPVPMPTVRQAIWWWRIMKAMPGVYKADDIFSVAGAFVEREIRHEVLGETLDLTDLEAWLAFAPWNKWPDDPASANRYLEAISDGVVPPLRTSSFEESFRFYWGQGFTDPQIYASQIAIRYNLWPNSDAPRPWLLPSHQKKDKTESEERKRERIAAPQIRTRASGNEQDET